MGDTKGAGKKQKAKAPKATLEKGQRAFIKELTNVLGSVQVEDTDQTLEKLFVLAGERDLLISNLFQLDDGEWRANVRSSVPDQRGNAEPMEYGFGESARIALARCLFNASVRAKYGQNYALKKFKRPHQ